MKNDDSHVLGTIFFNYESRRLSYANSKKLKFSHYTSAESAISILRNKILWLRNCSSMNDYSEVKYGESMLIDIWNNKKTGSHFKSILQKIDKNMSSIITNKLNEQRDHRKYLSYVSSLSEHTDRSLTEGKYGSLSMWRAYGGNPNVAFIFDCLDLFANENSSKIFASPVLYGYQKDVEREFKKIVHSMENNINKLTSIDPKIIINSIIWKFHCSALSIKHPGFREEKEWRLIYSPTINFDPNVKESIQTINGAPQIVKHLDIQDIINKSQSKTTMQNLIHSIIIGPTNQAELLGPAIASTLKGWQVQSPFDMIKISNIPLRR